MEPNEPDEMAHVLSGARTALICLVIWVAGAALALYSHDLLAAMAPGKFRVDTWRNLASGVFLLAAIAVAWFVVRTRHRLSAKISLVALFSLLSVCFAIVVQMRSMCGDEPTFIGEPPRPDEASCSA